MVVRQADFNALALAEHVWTMGHPVDWDNVQVPSNSGDFTTRLAEEAIAIRDTSNTLNHDNMIICVDDLYLIIC